MTITWNTSVYTQERSIMSITEIDANAAYIRVLILGAGMSGTVIKYAIPSSKNLDIDFSDLVRLSATGMCSISAHNAYDVIIGSTYTMQWTQAGRIRPTAVIAPECPMSQNSNFIITAPSVLLKSIKDTVPVQFELYGTDGYDISTMRIWFPPVSETAANYNTTIEIPSGANMVDFWHLADNSLYKVDVKELECDKTYALVEWVSFTGKTRRHTFEVVKSTTEYTESVDIETITNQYDQRKNRRDSFTLRLEGLTRYDLWYYSDLITSSQVKVSLDGTNWYQVEVTAKKQTIPETDAGKLNVLEIPINYRKYDTL